MLNSDNISKNKYLKYKSKYLKLKKNIQFGGSNSIPKFNDNVMLKFIKKIIKENANIRYNGKEFLKEFINDIIKIDDIMDFSQDRFKFILTKGCDRLYKLIDYITTDKEFSIISNNCKALIVAQYIIINQVFGDGNHRTALYVLSKYSNYSKPEIDVIMFITEKIHKGDGDFNNLWYGPEANERPNFDKLKVNPDISELMEK
jgi:hypothetical protein